MMDKLKNEPVMAFAVAIALTLAILITAGVITLDDVNAFVALFAKVLPIVVVALGFVVRSLVTPTRKD